MNEIPLYTRNEERQRRERKLFNSECLLLELSNKNIVYDDAKFG